VNERGWQEFAGFAAARSGALIRLAYVLTGDQHAAEDLLQTALTRAAARWGRIHTAPEAYLRQIMHREQISWWRRRARRREKPSSSRRLRTASASSSRSLACSYASAGSLLRRRAVSACTPISGSTTTASATGMVRAPSPRNDTEEQTTCRTSRCGTGCWPGTAGPRPGPGCRYHRIPAGHIASYRPGGQAARRRIDGESLLQSSASAYRIVSPTRRMSLGATAPASANSCSAPPTANT
jgi:hypothetical protein